MDNANNLQLITLDWIIDSKKLITDKNTLHSYCDFYQQEFSKYLQRIYNENEEIQLVEIGIDQGGSLILWAEYFGSKCKVLGVDLMLRGNCEQDCSKYPNIMLSTGNAYMAQSLQYMPEMDIFIDDGPHDITSQIFAVDHFLPKVKQGGLFVIEDVPNIDTALTLMTHVPIELKTFAEIVDLRANKGRSDDILFVVRIPKKELTKEEITLEHNNLYISRINEISDRIGMNKLSERFSHLYPLINFDTITEIINVGDDTGFKSFNFTRIFPAAIIHSFESDQTNFMQANETIRNQPIPYYQIKLNNLALTDKDGSIEIKEVMTPAVSLDTWCKIYGIKPQLIWMDAQGAELDILKGAEMTLQNVCVIMSEVAIRPYYRGHTMKVDIDEYLLTHGFEELISARKTGHEYEMDTIYIKKI